MHVCRPLGSENLLLRGATLKNTEFIYGNVTSNMLIYLKPKKKEGLFTGISWSFQLPLTIFLSE